ncbi:MAG: NAD(P)/FAD-dependent oxidoreductase [Bacteroidetes bacterium]|nr:NAD(P)/FAD-dependent oxidoreductase [Bacteroidota bacterium]
MSELEADLIIIGGGAAGFFSAIHAKASKPNSKVLILEKSNKTLAKVLVSGGGRCNVTFNQTDLSELISNYPRGRSLLKWVLRKWGVLNTIRWFEAHGVELKTEADGRMFPVTDSSATIVNALCNAASDLGVQTILETGIQKIEKTESGFLLYSNRNKTFSCKTVVIACGGFPKLEQFGFLSELGIEITPPVPSLFTFNIPDKQLHELMGLSVLEGRVKVTGIDKWFTGPVLITHWGLSGPAVLKTSAWLARELHAMNYQFEALVDWTSMGEEKAREVLGSAVLMHNARKISNTNPFDIPSRLWDFILKRSGVNGEKLCRDLSKTEKNKILENSIRCSFKANGKTTFKEEFVTAGGVSISEINIDNLECKKIPGLFFAGEIIDMDGITGGFNFQAAWATGYIAGSSAMK